VKLNYILQKIRVAIEEAYHFTALPSVVNRITDEKGRILLVQAPALKYLKQDVPQYIRFRWVYKGQKGEGWVPAEPIEQRRVVRRDSGIIPLYYFVP